jgi:uncharacterized membrane protein
MVVAGVLAYPELPAEMTIHWRIGLDGAVTKRVVSRAVGTFLLVPGAVGVLVFAIVFSSRIRNRRPELMVVYDAIVTAVLLFLVLIQAILLVLNVI